MVSSFKAIVVLHVEATEDADAALHRGAKVGLEISKNLDYDTYLDERGLPTKVGSMVLTNVLVQGLIANIHRANVEDHWKDYEHIKFIIDELQKGFIEVAHVEKEPYELKTVFNNF